MHKRFIFPSVFKNAQRITIIQLALNNRGYIFFTQFIDSIFSGVYFVTQSKSRAQLDAELAEKGTVGGKGK